MTGQDASERFRPSPKLGQNFLVDPNISRKIAESAGIQAGELALEVGPGRGILTRALLEAGARVLAIEMDYRLFDDLSAEFVGNKSIEIIRGDVLEVNLSDLLRARLKSGEKAAVVANLPYSISTEALFLFLEHASLFSRITVMLQKEVADRLAAGPGSRTYGALSAAVGLHGKTRALFPVGAASFKPQPRVDSAVVQITLSPLAQGEELALARQIVRAAFTRRRKQLRNSLLESNLFRGKTLEVDQALAKAGIAPTIRAEELSPEDFLKLARAAQT